MHIERGSWAVVTGASSGIGEATAHALAGRGCRIVLVARNRERLEAAARKIPTETICLTLDLSEPDGPEELERFVAERGLVCDILVNNAGLGSSGSFHERPLEIERTLVRVNAEALLSLTRLFLPGMVERGRGAVVLVSSASAWFPLPYSATYAATKSFVLSLGRALWKEARPHGVLVTTVCPGVTVTRFHDRAGMRRSPLLPRSSPEEIAREILRAVERDRRVVVPGWRNRMGVALAPLVPERIALSVASRALRG